MYDFSTFRAIVNYRNDEDGSFAYKDKAFDNKDQMREWIGKTTSFEMSGFTLVSVVVLSAEALVENGDVVYSTSTAQSFRR